MKIFLFMLIIGIYVVRLDIVRKIQWEGGRKK